MEKEPKKEVMLDPKWSILQDGLGYQVLVLGGMPGIDKNGREVIRFTIKPDEVVRKRYNLRRDVELDQNGNMEIEVLKMDLILLNVYDDANKKLLYVKSFKHEETELSQREANLKNSLVFKERRILLLEGQVLRLGEQLELARNNPAKFIKQGAEVFQESAKAFSELIKKKDEQ